MIGAHRVRAVAADQRDGGRRQPTTVEMAAPSAPIWTVMAPVKQTCRGRSPMDHKTTRTASPASQRERRWSLRAVPQSRQPAHRLFSTRQPSAAHHVASPSRIVKSAINSSASPNCSCAASSSRDSDPARQGSQHGPIRGVWPTLAHVSGQRPYQLKISRLPVTSTAAPSLIRSWQPDDKSETGPGTAMTWRDSCATDVAVLRAPTSIPLPRSQSPAQAAMRRLRVRIDAGPAVRPADADTTAPLACTWRKRWSWRRVGTINAPADTRTVRPATASAPRCAAASIP